MKGFFKILRRFVPPYKKQLALNIVFNILAALLTLFSFALIIPILEMLFGINTATYSYTPWGSASIDKVIVNNFYYYVQTIIASSGKSVALACIAAALVVMTGLKTGAAYMAAYFMISLRTGVVRDLRAMIYNKMVSLPIGFFSSERKGDVMARMSGDVTEVENSVMMSLDMMFKNPIMIVVCLAMMLFVSWQLTLFVFILLPVAGFIMGRVGKYLKRVSLEQQNQLGTIMSNIEETISGLRIIKAFNAEDKVRNRFASENEKYCDLLVKVPVRGMTSGSFTTGALNTLMERGEKAMREKMDSLMLLKEQAGAIAGKNYSIHLRNIQDMEDKAAQEPVTLIDTRKVSTMQASVGLRFDTEDLVAAQLNGRYYMGGRLNKELELTARLGLRSMLRLDFNIEPWRHKKMGLSYQFWYKYNNLYTHGKRTNNISLIYQHANARLFSLEAMNFDCELGLGWEHYHIFDILWNDGTKLKFNPNEHYFNYHLRLRYNSENSRYFTTRGMRVEAQYAYYTDNFAQMKGHSGISAVTAMWQMTIPLTRTTHLRPTVQGRLLFGDDIPITASNVVGGMTNGRFFPQQLSMVGIGHTEAMDSKFVSASLRLQQRITGQHYIILDAAIAEHNNDIEKIFDRRPLCGVQLAYFYNTRFAGPLGAALRWSNHTHRLNFFLTLGFDF